MTMERPIAARRFRARDVSLLSTIKNWRLPGDERAASWLILVTALVVAFAGSYTLSVRLTKAPPADTSIYSSLPATNEAPAAAPATAPEIAPALPAAAVAPQAPAVVHATKARVAAVTITRVAPVKQTPKTPAKTPTTSTPAPQTQCSGTVASVTQPVSSLLPGPIGGSGGVVQTVACALP